MTRILILTHGTEGDVRPMTQMGKAFLKRGHSVVCITHCAFEQPIRDAGLGFESVDTPGEYEHMLLHAQQLNTSQDYLRLAQEYHLPKYPVKFAHIQKHFLPGETVLLSSMNSLTLSQIAGEKLGLPVAAIYISPGHVFRRMLMNKVAPVIKPDIGRFRAQIGLPPEHDIRPNAKAIALWPEWYASFNPPAAKETVQVGFLPGGDPHEPLPADVEALLASGPAPILLTGGTGVFVEEDYYTACLDACRKLNRRVILVARRQLGLPRSLPANVSLFSALPFGSLMPRVGAAIHHGGVGTTAQGLAAGVPQVILAQGLDRPDNATRVERLGVGKFLPPRRWTADAVAAALTGVLDSPPVRARCQELAECIRTHDSLAAVTEAVEQTVRAEADVSTLASR